MLKKAEKGHFLELKDYKRLILVKLKSQFISGSWLSQVAFVG